uniref:Uncharacterized protein n=1 Tax=mine drainage metagenome TaxID=410659 RepID=E6QE85_9ZZZZ
MPGSSASLWKASNRCTALCRRAAGGAGGGLVFATAALWMTGGTIASVAGGGSAGAGGSGAGGTTGARAGRAAAGVAGAAGVAATEATGAAAAGATTFGNSCQPRIGGCR